MVSEDLEVINMTFLNPVSVSTMWRTGFLSGDMRYIYRYMLKTMIFLGMLVLKRNGDFE